MGENKYQDCYVAFLDILGFKELLKKDDFDQIFNIFKAIKEFKPRPIFQMPVYSEIKFHIMSDSIIVYVDATQKDSFVSLTDVCAQIQMYLLRQDTPIIVRGGISRGTLYCEDGIIFGTGLSQAYMLEEGLAVYPRVIFTESTRAQAMENSGYSKFLDHRHQFYLKDDDELFYLDYLDTFSYLGHTLVKDIGKSKQNDIAFFEKITTFVDQHLSYELNPSVRAKYLWLKKKIQSRIKQMPDIKKHFEEKEQEKQKKESAEMSRYIQGGPNGTYE